LMLGTEDATDIEATSLLNELEETPQQYDDAQPVDFIEHEHEHESESAENLDKIPPNQGEILGGVCDPLGGGEGKLVDGTRE
jgi:hypothetical protein